MAANNVGNAIAKFERSIKDLLLSELGVEASELSELAQDDKGVTTGKVLAQDGKIYPFELDREGIQVFEPKQ